MSSDGKYIVKRPISNEVTINTKVTKKEVNTKEILKRHLLLEEETVKHDAASPRFHWKNSMQYFLCIANLTLGIGNIVTFPRRSYKFEGGTFVLVYIIVLLIFGAPVIYMELIMGQYHRGTILVVVQRCAPILQGIGWLAGLSAVLSVVPYQYEVAKIFKYLLTVLVLRENNSYSKSCNNTWNTGSCYEFFNEKCVKQGAVSHAMYKGKCNVPLDELRNLESAEIQFLKMVQRKSQSFLDFGSFDRSTFFSLAALWLVTAMLFNRGLRKIGQSSYVPILLIFLVVPALLLSSLKMEGSIDGIKQLFVINWQATMETPIWIEAFQQIIFSLGVGYGSIVAVSSYSPPGAHTYKILMADLALDTSLSIMCTATVFATLGYMSKELGGMPIYDIVPSEDAEVVSHIIFPVLMRGVSDQSSLWIITYYVVMTMLGFGTSVQLVLSISSTFADHWNVSSKTYAFDKITIVTCIAMLILGSFLCFGSGDYWAALLNNLGGIVQVATIFFELIVMCEFYGVDHIYEDIQVLMGRPVLRFWGQIGYISPAWKFFWIFSPALSAAVIVFTTFEDFPFKENSRNYPYMYEIVECFLLLLTLLIIPCFMYMSTVVMKRHVEENERKYFDTRIMWMKQKQLRSWDRIESQMLRIDVDPDDPEYEEHAKAADNIKLIIDMLPENPPNDNDGMWRLVLRPFFKIKGINVKLRQEQPKEEKKPKAAPAKKTLQTMFTGTEKPEPAPKVVKTKKRDSKRHSSERTMTTIDTLLDDKQTTIGTEPIESVVNTLINNLPDKSIESKTGEGRKKTRRKPGMVKARSRGNSLEADLPDAKGKSDKKMKTVTVDLEIPSLDEAKTPRLVSNATKIEKLDERKTPRLSTNAAKTGKPTEIRTPKLSKNSGNTRKTVDVTVDPVSPNLKTENVKTIGTSLDQDLMGTQESSGEPFDESTSKN